MRLHRLPLSAGLTLLTLLGTFSLQAHPFHEHPQTFSDAFMHGFFGWDHLLAAFAFGLWALRPQHRHTLAIALMFVLAAGIGLAMPLFVPAAGPMAALSFLAAASLFPVKNRLSFNAFFAVAAFSGFLLGQSHAESFTTGIPFAFLAGMFSLQGLGAVLAWSFRSSSHSTWWKWTTAGAMVLAAVVTMCIH